MSLNFQKLSLDKQMEYRAYLDQCNRKASDYSMANLWGWAEEYGLYWAWTEQIVWIIQTKPVSSYWSPVGDWEKADWEKLFREHIGAPASFARIPEQLYLIWEKQNINMSIEDARGEWDYIYNTHELIELKGNRFHKKKNLVNRFKKDNKYKYVKLDGEMIRRALDMQKEWCDWHDCASLESLSAENRAIPRILERWNQLQGLTGGVIIVEDGLAAYTIAEYLDEETMLIHFEKGNTTYSGVYQAINQMFLEQEGGSYKYVNRMQDMDDDGLRKSKMSYRPVDFIKKYRVHLK